MVKALLAHNVVGIIGYVISFGLFLSPVPTFYKIIKKKDVEEFKSDPYIATILNCALWIFYGMPFVHPNNNLVVIINSVGFVFELIYLFIFYVYAKREQRINLLDNLAMQLCGALGVINFLFIVMYGIVEKDIIYGIDKGSLVAGIIYDILNIMMYVSPLTIMENVIKTKSVKYMPFWLALANFLNGCCWTTFALIHPFNIYILVGNGIGAISGLVQLLLYAYYWCWGNNNDDNYNHVPNPTLAIRSPLVTSSSKCTDDSIQVLQPQPTSNDSKGSKKGGHAAIPQHSIDPILATSNVIISLQLRQRIEQIIIGQAAVNRCNATVAFLDEVKPAYPPTVNKGDLHEHFVNVAVNMLGMDKVDIYCLWQLNMDYLMELHFMHH
ncbi:bidirectional sugar transporter SWEET5 [Trifolium repens]|nr:bidirectional sugar transporter SWEET5 [Trifolium repens]